jgi:hypothetical protein
LLHRLIIINSGQQSTVGHPAIGRVRMAQRFTREGEAEAGYLY